MSQFTFLETEFPTIYESAHKAFKTDKNTLDETIKQLRAELASVKQANTTQPDTHDYSEQQTRDIFIDLLLKEAGWILVSTPLNQRERSLSEVEGNIKGGTISSEFPVTGMPNSSGTGFVDYVLWGDDGKPLAVVEAKRTRTDPRSGQQQAKLYADC
ncbi:type I restriction endonuclease [Dolichospermum lemmermannii CS-548]|uniref:type I restriction endonuclease n=1 Tax=Dolichospermum lemmermannii TaxID=54295 RepID=UPI00233033F0|nr:type I restriction endonuclease [Dolichospermum lemmermannii]MDB9435642.1 type I restriction endonuclease [Dolichospermum lemmermannii CS-548]